MGSSLTLRRKWGKSKGRAYGMRLRYVKQRRSVPFKMREYDTTFYERGLISITTYLMTVIHIPFTQFNVTAIGLGYYMILEFALYTS